jgi:hypothetical protein
MVLGCGYDEVERQFQQDFDVCGVVSDHIVNFICDHNLSAVEKIARGYNDVRLSNKRMISPFADIHILSVLSRADCENNHAVVMDAKGNIFDPAKPERKDIGQYYCIVRIVGFYREQSVTKR